MKKYYLNLFFVSLIFFLGITSYANSGIPTGVPSRTPDPSSGCTGFENTAQCRPEWASAKEKCRTNSINESQSTCEVMINNLPQTVAICSPTNTTGPCRPERVNPYAAGTIARQAEIMAKQAGYGMRCEASRASFWGIDTNTGLQYYMNSLCSIAGTSMSGISAELLVNNYPNSWETMITEIKSEQASITCGGIQYVFFNTDGSFRCLPKPSFPSVTPTPNVPTPPVSNTTQSNQDSNLTENNLVSSIGQGVPYASSLLTLVRNLSQNLQNQLNLARAANSSLGTPTAPVTKQSQTPTTSTTNQTDTNESLIKITLENGAKSGVFVVGDLIRYVITAENIDSANSFYVAIPGDKCAQGSNNGEVKPWILKFATDRSVFSDYVQECQKGNTYIITVTGKNSKTNKVVADSITVYIKGDGLAESNPITIENKENAPSLNFTLDNGNISGTYNTGDTIIYNIDGKNIDSISSYYFAKPGDTCEGGSNSGENKPWILNNINQLGKMSDKVKDCQKGNTYIITVTGRNTKENKSISSSVIVSIR